jgi:hypothetical protein
METYLNFYDYSFSKNVDNANLARCLFYKPIRTLVCQASFSYGPDAHENFLT